MWEKLLCPVQNAGINNADKRWKACHVIIFEGDLHSTHNSPLPPTFLWEGGDLKFIRRWLSKFASFLSCVVPKRRAPVTQWPSGGLFVPTSWEWVCTSAGPSDGSSTLPCNMGTSTKLYSVTYHEEVLLLFNFVKWFLKVIVTFVWISQAALCVTDGCYCLFNGLLNTAVWPLPFSSTTRPNRNRRDAWQS